MSVHVAYRLEDSSFRFYQHFMNLTTDTYPVPVMRDNGLSVMSLEEYGPNKEFVGRNFNAGEIIQLVLKSRSGRWLPFDYVQMVMMHESVMLKPFDARQLT
jgi:hypothetical protein